MLAAVKFEAAVGSHGGDDAAAVMAEMEAQEVRRKLDADVKQVERSHRSPEHVEADIAVSPDKGGGGCSIA